MSVGKVASLMAVPSDLHRAVDERLAARDQRYTSSRRRIVDALVAAGRPVTLPVLLAEEPTLAQSSAYRNLAVLEEAGVVRRLVHGADHGYYELAEDLTEHHHHLICLSCGQISDVTLGGKLERSLDAAFVDVAADAGFVPEHHAIDIYGRCAQCVAAR